MSFEYGRRTGSRTAPPTDPALVFHRGYHYPTRVGWGGRLVSAKTMRQWFENPMARPPEKFPRDNFPEMMEPREMANAFASLMPSKMPIALWLRSSSHSATTYALSHVYELDPCAEIPFKLDYDLNNRNNRSCHEKEFLFGF